MQHTLFKYFESFLTTLHHTLSYHITLLLDFSGYRSSMNNMEEIVKFTENHQKQEVTVVEPTDEMSEKLFKFLHKSDVRIISVIVDC